jgi:hypothetical protein
VRPAPLALGTGVAFYLAGTAPALDHSAFFGSGPADGACASCHPAEWDEWSGSRHALAWVDPVFQAEFARGRAAWCVGCHAPLVPDPAAPDPALAASGVACGGCHQQGGRMVSARRAENSPHATEVDPAFGSADFCARCHEFDFPVLGERGRLVRSTGEPMQATVSEWRKSAVSRELGCTDCHADSPAGHAFRGSHDPELVSSALRVDACRDRGAIEVALANRGAGHNVPSGGVHRRIVLRAWTSRAPERLDERVLGRRFRPLAGGGKQTTSDTTIPPGGTTRHRFDLAALGRAREINLELRYVYALDERLDSRVIWQRRLDPQALPGCDSARIGE